jgi:NSS family neurotransmitter:Na+ symporter
MVSKPIARDQWTRTGFLLAAIGSAVGIGNIWRFPYMVGINGGGAFLIPYLLGVLVFSLPLMILELDSGRHFRASVLSVMRRLDRRLLPAGILPIIISLGVAGYYFVITGWSLAYFLFSLIGYIPFTEFTGSLLPAGFFLVTLVITSVIVARGIKSGIERMAMILMPIFVLLLVLLTAYSLTLPGAVDGLGFYLTPDFSYLGDMSIWVMGIVQAFFSLAVGYGILLTYASYLDRRVGVSRYALGIAGADTMIALVGGLLVFPIVFSFGLDPAAGSGLTFLSLPLVFQSMPFGQLIGAAFFLLLFVAGLTSAVGFFEVGATSFVDELSWSRVKSTLIGGVMILMVGILASLTFFGNGLWVSGLPLIEFLDQMLGQLLLVSASMMAIGLTWFHKPDVFAEQGREGLAGRLKRLAFNALKYVIPPVLILIFLLNLVL